MATPYDKLKELQQEMGIKHSADMRIMTVTNDPFSCGSPAQVAAGEWFVEHWNKFGYTSGVHLRRIHYRLVSQDPPVLRPKFKRGSGGLEGWIPYENTIKSWQWLAEASQSARYLKMIDFDVFDDRKNPEALIHAKWMKEGDYSTDWPFGYYQDPEPGYGIGGFQYWDDTWSGDAENFALPELPELDGLPDELPKVPWLGTTGYKHIQQDYHLEIWAEKSTMNDILIPLCQRFKINLCTATGEFSITRVAQLMERIKASERPTRVLYVSDLDPKGADMPVSVARKIEMFQRDFGYDDLDIRLELVALTLEQARRYQLPRIPTKKGDSAAARFERAYGEGATELDALEALHPGELRTILEGRILQYFDPFLVDKAKAERRKLQEELDEEQDSVSAEYKERIKKIEGEYSLLLEDFDELRDTFALAIGSFQERIDAHQDTLNRIMERWSDVIGDIAGDLEEVEVDLDDHPLPEPDLPEETNGALYISDRDYFGQLAAYKFYREAGSCDN